MYENVTLSEGLERIDYSLERIRNATGTQGQTVENVAYAVELGYDMLNDKNVYIRNYYPSYITGTLTSARLNRNGLSIDGTITRLNSAAKQIYVYCVAYNELDDRLPDNYRTDWLYRGLYIDFENDNVEVGETTTVGFDLNNLYLYDLGQIDHFVLMFLICNNDGTLATPMSYNYITPDENVNIGYIQYYKDFDNNDRRFCYIPLIGKFNKHTLCRLIDDPGYDLTTDYQPYFEQTMYNDFYPEQEVPAMNMVMNFEIDEYMDNYGFSEEHLIPLEWENRDEVPIDLWDYLGWWDYLALVNIGPRGGESGGSLSDTYKTYFNLYNDSYSNYDYTVTAVYDDESETVIAEGILGSYGSIGISYTTTSQEIAASLVKYVITTTLSEVQPEPEPDEGESI